MRGRLRGSRAVRYLPVCFCLFVTACPREKEQVAAEPGVTPKASVGTSTKADGTRDPSQPSAAGGAIPGGEKGIERELDAGGLKVSFYSSGHISVAGVDRWGQRLEYEYDSAEYFRKAVPVLARSLTPSQGEALGKVVAELAAEKE